MVFFSSTRTISRKDYFNEPRTVRRSSGLEIVAGGIAVLLLITRPLINIPSWRYGRAYFLVDPSSLKDKRLLSVENSSANAGAVHSLRYRTYNRYSARTIFLERRRDTAREFFLFFRLTDGQLELENFRQLETNPTIVGRLSGS